MVPEKKAKPLRIVGKTIDKDVDIYTGLQNIDGLRTNKIERILTKAGLYTYKMKDTRKDKKKGAKPETTKRSFEKVYPKVGELSWKEKARLIDLLEMPRAILRNIHTSPKKLRLVADAIRGKSVDEAKAMLRYMEKGGAPIILKLLESAIHNASENHNLKNADDLYIAKITIDGAATMKRFMARARGRAARIRCRTSHAKIVLRETNEAIYRELRPRATAETKPAKKAKVKKVAKTTTKATKATKAQGGKE